MSSAVPAVIRGADEKRWVRRQCLDAAVRQSAAIGLLVLPLVAVVALAFASAGHGRALIAWILAALVCEVLVIVSLVRYRSAALADEPERALPALHLAYAAVGAVWGATTSVMDWSGDSHAAVYVMFPFTIAVMLMVQTSAFTGLFRASQIALVSVGVAGLLVSPSALSVMVAACAVLWYGLAEALHRSMHEAVVRGHQLRWRADELVVHLRSERVRLAEANQQLAVQAVHDPLTGLLNRRGAMEALDHALAELDETGAGVGVLYIDIDLFKSINDGLGHRAGDRLLEVMAERITASLRSGASAGRLGGDELVVIVPGCSDVETLAAIATRLRLSMGEDLDIEGRSVSVSASIGVSLAPDHGRTATELLRTANEGLHRAKAQGRNRVITFDESLRAELANRAMIDESIRAALDNGEIQPAFVPEFDSASGALVGAEIVARWTRPDGSEGPTSVLRSPEVDTTLLEQVSETLVAGSRPVIRDLALRGLPSGFRFRLSVTSRASTRTWTQERLNRSFTGIDPSLMTITVAEQAIRHDLTLAAAALGAFRALGICVALDDVAAGSTSLSVLRSVPLDEIRIDRRSLDAIDTRSPDRAIVRALVGLARDLGLRISATGVDTGAQADALMALGCTRQQGAHYFGALSGEALEILLFTGATDRVAT